MGSVSGSSSLHESPPSLPPIIPLVRREAFETATRRASPGFPTDALARYLPQVAVSVLVVIVLTGGALYAARVSESPPGRLQRLARGGGERGSGFAKVNLYSADTDELDELPQVGPATAESIVEYRRTNGMFRSVEELASIHNCKTMEVRFRASLTRDKTQILELREQGGKPCDSG